MKSGILEFPHVPRQVEDLFSKYGRVVEIDLKLPPRPPGFAFVEFAHSRDAQDAVDGRDGYDFYGSRLRVRLAVGSMSLQSPCQQPGVCRTSLQPAALCSLRQCLAAAMKCAYATGSASEAMITTQVRTRPTV